MRPTTRIHRKQEGRFFHGYYGHYCYLRLYIFCGEFLLCARLRSSNIDASAGSVDELKVWVSLARGYPYAELFRQIHAKLSGIPLQS
jgi:hypothetical protein